MASDRRRSQAIRTDLSSSVSQDAPPNIAALFLIRFDIRAGYTVAWKRSIPDAEVENVVEFKSLPSGSHNVKEDLVYFVHGQYAGISAFVNKQADEAERNALMLAVGVLVPLSYGRLGRSWRHAASLKDLAGKLGDDPENTEPLLKYWNTFQISEGDDITPPESPLDSISSRKSKQAAPRDAFSRRRALSEATALMTSKQVLAPFHPALSLPEFLDSFGPLVFPLYRAALLRKRILFMGEAPVQSACNFVYDLSLLSSLPHTLLPLLPPTAAHALRPRPQFNVGIHDMPYLLSLPHPSMLEPDSCWVACSTDRVLGMKPELYDILVTLPPSYSAQAPEKTYPKIALSTPTPKGQKPSDGVLLKATQRDARRYLSLRNNLHDLSHDNTESSSDQDEDSDTSSTFSSSPVVEPLSWPLLAYTSFIWWASAGEKGAGPSEEESQQDSRLLLTDYGEEYNPHASTRRGSIAPPREQSHQPREIALITYFRRLTTQIFTVLSDIIIRHDGDNPEDDEDGEAHSEDGLAPDSDEEVAHSGAGDEDEPLLRSPSHPDTPNDDEIITITSADMASMGLDVWSATDRTFAEEMVSFWWGRKAEVQGARVKCCGVRIL